MTDSGKYRLIVLLVLAAICLPAAAKDPNGPATGLRFEVEQKLVGWDKTDMFGRSSNVRIKEGLVRPSHRALLFISNVSRKTSRPEGMMGVDFQGPEAIKKILDTPAGQKISPAQRKFLKTGKAIYR